MDDIETPRSALITRDNITSLSRCYSLSLTARCLSIVDLLVTIFFAINYTYYILAVFFPIIGYVGATFFLPRWLLMYRIYLIAMNLSRTTFLIILFSNQSKSEHKNYILQYSLGFVCSILECWCARIIYRMQKEIQLLTENEKAYIKTIVDCNETPVICW